MATKIKRDEKWEKDVLAYHPFSDDKDDGGWRHLKDKISTARKARPCFHCGEQIMPGTRIRTTTEVHGREISSIRACQNCCDAMALSWYDDGDAMEARIAKMLAMRGE